MVTTEAVMAAVTAAMMAAADLINLLSQALTPSRHALRFPTPCSQLAVIYQSAPPRSGGRIFLGILAGATLLVICNVASLLIKIYA
jgi:hypothetical protein